MIKQKNVFLLIFTLIILLPIKANADTSFVDGNKTYTIEEKEVTCLQNLDYEGEDENGNPLFSDNNMMYYRLNSDNTCTQLSNQEILDIINKFTSYYLDKNADDDYIIVKETVTGVAITSFIKTKDITPVDGKKYYLETSNNQMNEVVNLDSDMSEYYEMINLDYPKTATIDSNTTYYKLSDTNVLVVEEVENPISDEILSYYVTSTTGDYETNNTTIKTLPKVFNDIIGTVVADVFMFNDDDGYIIVGQDKSKLYDLDGNLMFEDAFEYKKIGDLYIVTKFRYEDNGDVFETFYTTNFYNMNKELLYSTETLYFGLEEVSDLNIIKGFNIDGNKQVIIKVTSSNSGQDEETPKTFDRVESSIIIGIISLIGLVSATTYFVKRNKLNIN